MILWSKLEFYCNDFDSTVMKNFLLFTFVTVRTFDTVFTDVLWYILFFVLGVSGEDFMLGMHTVIYIVHMQVMELCKGIFSW